MSYLSDIDYRAPAASMKERLMKQHRHRHKTNRNALKRRRIPYNIEIDARPGEARSYRHAIGTRPADASIEPAHFGYGQTGRYCRLIIADIREEH